MQQLKYHHLKHLNEGRQSIRGETRINMTLQPIPAKGFLLVKVLLEKSREPFVIEPVHYSPQDLKVWIKMLIIAKEL